MRYIFAASIVVRINPATNDNIETASCQNGTPPDGMRAIITMEDEKGMMLDHTAIGVSGLAAAEVIMIKESMMGIVIGSIRD